MTGWPFSFHAFDEERGSALFTGIVQGLCPVVAIEDATALMQVFVALGELGCELQLGASVAINGVCLTVTATERSRTGFDVIKESLENTNLPSLETGTHVNVERSFRVGDEIGGHILSGHVAGVATVDDIEIGSNERNLWFDVDAQWMKYLHHKGFVALDGASLTIAAVDHEGSRIKVALIPETIARTTLGTVAVGTSVNLEIDAQTQAIVATVERVLADRLS